MNSDYHTLDTIVVCAFLAMLAAAGTALVFVKIPQENLPILAGLVSGTAGAAIGSYVTWRWSMGPKKTDPAGATVTTPPGPTAVTVDSASGRGAGP